MPRLEARAAPSRLMGLLAPLAAAALTVLAGGIMFALLGHPPLAALRAFFIAPLADLYGWGELTLKAAPILLCALGLAIGFRAGIWNIGAEGQLILGAMAGGALALYLPGAPKALLLPGMLVAGALGGMAWAAIPAFLRVRFNANEILTTLMLTYVAGLLLSYMVYGPWRSPTGFNWPESTAFTDAGRLPRLLSGTRLNLGFVLALVAVAGAWLFVARSHLAYRMQVAGEAPLAARYAGFSASGVVWLGLLIGGAAAGVAGVVEVAGTIGKLRETISPGYGFSAIIVAFIGRLHPVGILLASLLMAVFYIGGEAVKVELGLPAAITFIFQGLLLFFLLMSDLMVNYRLRFRGAGESLRAG